MKKEGKRTREERIRAHTRAVRLSVMADRRAIYSRYSLTFRDGRKRKEFASDSEHCHARGIHNRKTLLVIARRDSPLLANPRSRLSPFLFPFTRVFGFPLFALSLNAPFVKCDGIRDDLRIVRPVFTRVKE